MNLMVKAEGIFLGVSKTDYVSKSTGKPGCYYNVAIKQGGEVGSWPKLYKSKPDAKLRARDKTAHGTRPEFLTLLNKKSHEGKNTLRP